MVKLRSKGGETVKAGTYWNYDTGEKIRMEENGVLPGKSSQSYVKFPPPMLPTLGLILIGIVPGYMSGLYAAYTERLMEAYVTFGILATVGVFGFMSIMVYRDRAAFLRKIRVYRLSPSEPVSETEDLIPVKIRNSQTEN
ncbi:MAG: hypothetical protein WA610_04020 [Thermodesulfovibrionales bacterium]